MLQAYCAMLCEWVSIGLRDGVFGTRMGEALRNPEVSFIACCRMNGPAQRVVAEAITSPDGRIW